MDIDNLREMIMLAEKKNYARAAEQLYISQSALSRHISALENKLKVQLFERNPRQVKLTSYGEALIPFAKSIIDLEDESIRAIENLKVKEQKSIVVGSVHGLENYGIMSKIAGFVAENKNLSFNLEYRESAALIDMLDKGEIDVAIICAGTEKEIPRHKSLTLCEDQLVVILPKGHPLSDSESIEIKDLADEEWIVQEDSHFLSEIMRELTWGSGVGIKKAPIHVGGVGILELVSQGLGIALEQQKIAQAHICPGLSSIPLIPTKKIKIAMLWRRNISAPAELFVEHMKKNRR